MCFTVPLRIKKITGTRAVLEDGREVRLALTPRARVGGYVLAQADVALTTLTKREAMSMRKLIKKSAKNFV